MNARIHHSIADKRTATTSGEVAQETADIGSTRGTIGSTGRRKPGLEWWAAGRPAPGETVSGDEPVVVSWEGGVLVGLIDGLGHGAEAAHAAQQAAVVLRASAQLPLAELVSACDRALRVTRGVVMTLVSFSGQRGAATAIGVGNVEAHLFRRAASAGARRETILLRGGVVGYQLPPLQASELVLAPGDRIVMATDGVWPDFAELVSTDEPLPNVVERVLARKFRGTDDGWVLACTYQGDE